MCTELLLAIIYFITIFVVNFFLYKLLKSYWNNIFYLLRLKNIYQFNKTGQMEIISNLYLYLKNKTKNKKTLFNLNKFSKKKDILIIGNIYKLLKNNTIDLNNYYFKLLEIQYLAL